MRFEIIKQNLLSKLKDLDTRLIYHNIQHTLDVLEQAGRIAAEEKISAKKELYLLKLAALYHDSGFLKNYEGHEEVSCKIFLGDAAAFGLSETEIKLVQQLIMATKITNEPKTILEKILRDADLDYLGRNDFSTIACLLKKELLSYKFIATNNDWSKRQLAFLETHHYYTKSSQLTREPVKQQNLQALIK